MKTVNVSLVGVGGQGIILTADILAKTAALAGLDVKKSEIHGMAQRGGSVSSQVRFGDSVASPIIQDGASDILVSFDKLEAVRNAHLLADGGVAIVNDMYLVPVTVSSGQQPDVSDLDERVAAIPGLKLVDAMRIATEEVGNPRTMNMVLAGALSAFTPFPEETWIQAISDMMTGSKAKLLEVNKKAFALGRAAAYGIADRRMRKPEILSPAGDFTCLQAALDAGADAVYFGLGTFNMRARSGVNFAECDLPEISSRCRESGAKAYLALNAIMFEGEEAAVERTIIAAKQYVDAFIVSDWGVISLCRRHGVAFHVSTQMSTSNSIAVNFLASQGASRVVLARECTLEEVSSITARTGVEVECFVHGAQCVAESGRCFMSHEAFGKSACRGECTQPCRRRFLVKAVDFFEDDEGNPIHESDTAFLVEPHTVMSARDLCSLGFIDRLMAAGISSFKIEGRARNAEYVKTVTAAYRRAVDAVAAGEYSQDLVAELTEDVKKVFHREFSSGLYFGRPGRDQFTDSENSLSTTVKRHVGIVVDYFIKAGIAQVKIQDHALATGNEIQIHGNTTGVIEMVAGELRRDEEIVSCAERGTWVTLKTPRCRVGDKVFYIERR